MSKRVEDMPEALSLDDNDLLHIIDLQDADLSTRDKKLKKQNAPFAGATHAPTHATAGSDPLTAADIGAEPTIAPKRTAFNRDYGSTVGTVCQGSDSRLSNARTPIAHAVSHAIGGSDEVTPAAIGAEVAGAANAAVSAHDALATAHGDRIPNAAEAAAISGANAPSGGNVFATQADLVGGSTDEKAGVTANDTAPGYLQDKFISGDASVSITKVGSGNEQLDLRATGAGGGESNTGENIGTGVEVYAGMNGTVLQSRSIIDTASVEWTQSATELSAFVPANTFDTFGAAAAVNSALTTHKSSADHDARYLQDAPSDGNPYVRQDASWAQQAVSPVGGVSMSYVFDISTTMADPTPGVLRCNNVDQTLATQVAISKWSNNTNDLSLVFDNMVVGSYFSVWEAASNNEGIYYEVTVAPVKNADEWYLIGVSAVQGAAGGIDNAAPVLVSTIANPADRVAPGGTTGQVYTKQSGDDYDADWETPSLPPSIDQWDIAARVAAGTGDYAGVTTTDLVNQPVPAAGHLLLGWDTGELKTFDVGDLPGGGGNYYTKAEQDATDSAQDAEIAGKWGSGSTIDYWINDLDRGGAGTYPVTDGLVLRITNTSSGVVNFTHSALGISENIRISIRFLSVAADVPQWQVNGTPLNLSGLPSFETGKVHLLTIDITSDGAVIAGSAGLVVT